MILEEFNRFLTDSKIYNPDQIDEVIKEVRHYFRFSQLNTKHKYFNVPCAFDIETSSFYDQGEKVGLMYAWMFGIYGLVIIGRTWDEFIRMINQLVGILDLNDSKRIVVYVHNLQFDFQFFRSHFSFDSVFAIDSRKPLYALTDSGIEFRCSYLLSGYNLDTLGKNLLKYQVRKKTGDLNYDLIRTPETPLQKKERGYCVSDVKVVMAYVAEEIERQRGIARLPYTKTGFVRTFCRNSCFYEPGVSRKKTVKKLKYHDLMKRLTLTAPLYDHLKNAFCGGFTHANAIFTKKIVYDVSSFDFTSSYPAVMVSELFPMGTPHKIPCEHLLKEQFFKFLEFYCCIFTIHFKGLREKPEVYENYISRSKCLEVENPVVNNGRVVSADTLVTTITEVDFKIIEKMYDWDSFQVSNLYVWIRGYLPKDFVLSILSLYKSKTELKGVEGKELEYQVSKGMLNATFGMCCTDIVRTEYKYFDNWLPPVKPDTEIEIDKYNKKWNRFLYYPWGIYITAYSRANLFSGILEAGEDYVYSDTDSIKLINAEKHKKYFEDYNRKIIKKLEKALKAQDIDVSYIRPKTVKGVEKPLGVWDYEGKYSRFKTLGAKRYLIEKDGELELTVAGLNKKITVPYLKKKYKTNDAVFAAFDHGLEVPPEFTGKRTHTYIDSERAGEIVDYMGEKYHYSEKTAIHLEAAPYDLSIAPAYNDFLSNLLWKGI